MKNGKKTAAVAVIAVVLLAACGKKADETIVSGEMAVPEMSSEDLLVSSLEYLLLDDTEEQQDSQDRNAMKDSQSQNDAEDSRNIANAEESGDAVGEQQNPDEEQGESAVIYYGSGGSSDLKEEAIILQEKTADELISALAKHNIVSLDTKVLSFEEEEKDGTKVLHLDLSKAAGEYLRTMSEEAECIIVASVVSTFVENYDADAVYLMVEGKPLVTSNAEYTQAIGRCTPEELMKSSGESDANALQEQDAAEPDEADSEDDPANEVQSKLPLIQEKE